MAAKIVGTDPATDLAVIKMKDLNCLRPYLAIRTK